MTRTALLLALALLAGCSSSSEETGSGAPTSPSAADTPEPGKAPGRSAETPSPGEGPAPTKAPAQPSPPVATVAGPCESPGATEEAEGNDDALHATRVGAGAAVRGTIDRPDDEDWFVIETCGERLLKVHITNHPTTSTPVDYRVDVRAADGRRNHGRLDDHDGGDGTTLGEDVWYIEAGEKVYVRIWDHGSDDFDRDQGYRLTLTPLDVPDADNEPNGNKNENTNRALATALTAGEAGTGFIASHGDEDWWKIEVTEETLLTVELSNAPATRSPVDHRMEVYGPSGPRIDSRVFHDGDAGIAMLSTTIYAGEAGTYYVRVFDHGDDEHDLEQPYRVTVTMVPVPDADHEPNGNANDDTNRALATPLALGGEPGTGFIGFHQDEDWWKVEVTAAGTVSVTLATTATSSDVDYRLELQDAQGNELAREIDSDGSDGMTRLTVSASVGAAGTYYVRVYDHGNDEWDTDDGYTLTASP